MSLPIGEAFDVEELERRFRALEVRPPQNPEHAFAIRVPREWASHHHEAMDRAVGAGALTPLAGWQGPGPDEDGPPIFHVQAIQLEREITAKNFLLLVASRMELKGHFLREVSPVFADALAEQSIGGAKVLERAAVAIDGDRAFVLMGISRPELYLEMEQTFGAMVASFRVITPSARRTIEPWAPYALLREAVRFEHPASWRAVLLRGSDDQRAVVTLFGYDPDEIVGGLIHVEAARGRPLALEEEYERILGACRLSKIAPAPREPHEDIPLEVEGERYRGLGMRRYPAMIEGNDVDQEIWIAVLEAQDLAVRVWMTGPAKGGDFAHWATNRRALEIVLGTLR